MNWKEELRPLVIIAVVFIGLYLMPESKSAVTTAITEAFLLAGWYAGEHVVFCLIIGIIILFRFQIKRYSY